MAGSTAGHQDTPQSVPHLSDHEGESRIQSGTSHFNPGLVLCKCLVTIKQLLGYAKLAVLFFGIAVT